MRTCKLKYYETTLAIKNVRCYPCHMAGSVPAPGSTRSSLSFLVGLYLLLPGSRGVRELVSDAVHLNQLVSGQECT